MAFEEYSGLQVLASSTYDDITLQLVKDNFESYYVKSMHTLEIFNVPDVNEILNLRNGSTVAPNCFILFRRQMQSCVSNIGLRIGRGALSKHISRIWKELGKTDPNLVYSFKDVANNVARNFNNKKLRFKMVESPYTE
ncbi:hypothetical protein C2G38_2045325 [Gigaspora rosea]|uniref:HMG box domain-containing protein n=1 Tax=Gigaspora rosea TaxID=44941 RepID=A0A397ULK6_9GLOM|nr:hypothetical protein C2G38_2045325 [Gigaspora rosea]